MARPCHGGDPAGIVGMLKSLPAAIREELAGYEDDWFAQYFLPPFQGKSSTANGS